MPQLPYRSLAFLNGLGHGRHFDYRTRPTGVALLFRPYLETSLALLVYMIV